MKEFKLKTYVATLLAFAVTLAACWAYWYGLEFSRDLLLGTLILAGLILLGDAFPVRMGKHHTIGVWDIGLVVAVIALGPFWAAIAALPSAFFVGRRNWLRTTYEISHSVTIVYLAGLAAFSLSFEPLLTGAVPYSAMQLLYGAVTTGLVLAGANKIIVAILLKIKYDQSLLETWKEDFEPYVSSDVVNILAAAFGVLSLAVYGPAAAVVVVGGAIASQFLVYRSRDQARENSELRERVRSLEESLKISNTTFGLMMIADLGRKDGYTDRHAAATAVYVADLGREMKLDGVRVERLRMAGLLHNVGLFTLPEDLLLTTGKLNSVAKSRLFGHAARGEEALAAVPEFREMASWVRWHHERPDGRGYPDKLRGPWIPLEAKILGVAQAYAAMVLDQPRRSGMTPEAAREELISGIDTQFDGAVVRAFLRILDTEAEGYRMADDYRFLFPDPHADERPASLVEPNAPTAEKGAGLRKL